jgi:carboxymethylenebutenolidase
MIVRESVRDLPTSTGPMRTYIYLPTEPNRPPRRDPGLVLYSEIFQQTAPVRRLAIQFAGRGYVVMVPEVYHSRELPGTVLAYDDDGKTRGNSWKQLIPLSVFDEDCTAVLDALREQPECNGRFGAVGICLGGHLAFRAALHPEVRAAACFYPTDLHSGTLGAGGKADSLARAADIRGELLMVFGRQDPHVPYEGRRQIYEALQAGGVHFTWHEFNAAHAFLRDEGGRYDPAASHLCFDLAADLFQHSL